MQTRSLAALLFLLTAICARAQTSAFTYQGRLSEGGVPANGSYQFQITLQTTAGSQVVPPVFPVLGVTNGLFTITLDWGNEVFDGSVRFLEIGVRTNGSVAPYTILAPRQEITSAPYAVQAATAGVVTGSINDIQLSPNIPRLDGNATFSGFVTLDNASGTFSGNGAALTNVNASSLNGLGASSFWKVSGNETTSPTTNVLGVLASDNKPLDLYAAGSRGLRLEPTRTNAGFTFTGNNVIGGYASNSVSNAVGATIAGGGGYSGGSQGPNNVTADFGSIGGGYLNTAAGQFSVVPGGSMNTASGSYSLAAGRQAKATNAGAFVWADSTASDFSSTQNNQFLVRASGGVGINKNNPATALDVSGTVTATGFAGNGASLTNLSAGNLATGTISDNRLSTNVVLKSAPYFASEAIASNGLRLNDSNLWFRGGSDVGSGLGWYGTGKTFASTTPDGPVLFGWSGGGLGTMRNGQYLALKWDYLGAVSVMGNLSATNLTAYSDVTAARVKIGSGSTLSGTSASIAGGINHNASGFASFIGGGENNTASSFESTVAGGSFNRATGEKAFIGAGYGNTNSSYESGIMAGQFNLVNSSGQRSIIGAGLNNSISSDAAFIGSGTGNSILLSANNAVIGGGMTNSILGSASYAVIGGGSSNTIQVNATYSTIGGGWLNSVQSSASLATIAGGLNNVASGAYAMVPGGSDNIAASLGFAAGSQAKATNSGAFVWSDNSGTVTGSTNSNSVTMRASGGFRLISSSGTSGAYLAPGSGTWASLSDRNMKENFETVDTREILDKVASLSIARWNYTTQDKSTRHIGPVAQDFSAAFEVGENDTTITTVDADGVALAAIQGLNEVVKEKDARIQKLEAKNSDLERRLNELEAVVRALQK